MIPLLRTFYLFLKVTLFCFLEYTNTFIFLHVHKQNLCRKNYLLQEVVSTIMNYDDLMLGKHHNHSMTIIVIH